jgi:hypothetical protein
MGLTQSQVLFPVMVLSWAAVLATSQFCWDAAGTVLVFAWVNELHPTELELDVYTLD